MALRRWDLDGGTGSERGTRPLDPCKSASEPADVYMVLYHCTAVSHLVSLQYYDRIWVWAHSGQRPMPPMELNPNTGMTASESQL